MRGCDCDSRAVLFHRDVEDLAQDYRRYGVLFQRHRKVIKTGRISGADGSHVARPPTIAFRLSARHSIPHVAASDITPIPARMQTVNAILARR
ncbi:MAG: hypothetical protein P3W94_004520, partial [Paracoccus sp. (in: a-proteobacteria)]|nr:hypothetical protein [Paracoccus sp. (in: a-proteobacteria)]